MRFSSARRFIPALCLAALPLMSLPPAADAQVAVGVSINLAPPALPVYVQPAVPAPGYLWTPGYWAWGPMGYYWVPGTWVAPPAAGLLWTPGYWSWSAGGAYVWNAGYWGPTVGFYGGVNYGFGYVGHGYWGGQWQGGTFQYNSAVTNVTNVSVTNVYNRTVVNNVVVNRVSFNGGPGGVVARPTQAEMAAAHERHVAFTPMQRQQEQLASRNHALLASANGGRPPIAATARPGAFSGHGVVAARAAGGPFREASARPGPKTPAQSHGGRPGEAGAFNQSRGNAAEPHGNPASHPPGPQHFAAGPQDRAAARPQQHAAPHGSGGHEERRPAGDREHDQH